WLIELLDIVTVLLLTAEADPTLFQLILNRGAGGILPVDSSSEQITQAIKSVAAGLMIFEAASIRDTAHNDDDDSPAESLTPREREVLALLADGLGNREIAARLNISEHTIKFHIRSILGKLGASSRTEAVTRGIRSGLIEL